MNAYFLEKVSDVHAAAFAAVRFGSVYFRGKHASGSEQGHMENVDWNFSDVGVLYMEKVEWIV